MTYYNTKTNRFEKQTTKSRSAAKILISSSALEATKIGTYGPDELPGHYVSKIGECEFLWDDLTVCLLNPDYDIRVYNPTCYEDCAYIDR